MNIVLFEVPAIVEALAPLSSTRALFTLRMGAFSLLELLNTLVHEQKQENLTEAIKIYSLYPHSDHFNVYHTLGQAKTAPLPLAAAAPAVIKQEQPTAHLQQSQQLEFLRLKTAGLPFFHEKTTPNTTTATLYLNAALLPHVAFLRSLLGHLTTFHWKQDSPPPAAHNNVSAISWRLPQTTASPISSTAEPRHGSSAHATLAFLTTATYHTRKELFSSLRQASSALNHTLALPAASTLTTIDDPKSAKATPNPTSLATGKPNSDPQPASSTKNTGNMANIPTTIAVSGEILFYELHHLLTAHEKLLADHLTFKIAVTPPNERTELVPHVFIHHGNQTSSVSKALAKLHNTPIVFEASAQKPIWIEKATQIGAYSILSGPLYVGALSQIAPQSLLRHSSLGQNTRSGGEISTSVIHDFSNKSHFGFLGHSIVGSWVNLGAGTTVSNLKNTYETVAYQRFNGERIMTSRTFLGAFIGDYTKTAILTGIYGGVLVGVACSLLQTTTRSTGHFQLLHHIPSKNQHAPTQQLPLEKILHTQHTTFQRRNKTPQYTEIALLRTLYNLTYAATHH